MSVCCKTFVRSSVVFCLSATLLSLFSLWFAYQWLKKSPSFFRLLKYFEATIKKDWTNAGCIGLKLKLIVRMPLNRSRNLLWIKYCPRSNRFSTLYFLSTIFIKCFLCIHFSQQCSGASNTYTEPRALFIFVVFHMFSYVAMFSIFCISLFFIDLDGDWVIYGCSTESKT